MYERVFFATLQLGKKSAKILLKSLFTAFVSRVGFFRF